MWYFFHRCSKLDSFSFNFSSFKYLIKTHWENSQKPTDLQSRATLTPLSSIAALLSHVDRKTALSSKHCSVFPPSLGGRPSAQVWERAARPASTWSGRSLHATRPTRNLSTLPARPPNMTKVYSALVKHIAAREFLRSATNGHPNGISQTVARNCPFFLSLRSAPRKSMSILLDGSCPNMFFFSR